MIIIILKNGNYNCKKNQELSYSIISAYFGFFYFFYFDFLITSKPKSGPLSPMVEKICLLT